MIIWLDRAAPAEPGPYIWCKSASEAISAINGIEWNNTNAYDGSYETIEYIDFAKGMDISELYLFLINSKKHYQVRSHGSTALENIFNQMHIWINAWRAIGGEHCEGRFTAMEMAERLIKRGFGINEK